MNLRKQKQLAARALKTSPHRVKITGNYKDVSELISRESVKDLVSEGGIKKLPKKGNSRTKANFIAEQKKKGRRQGHGSRKGTKNARFNQKEKWVIKIRALRSMLKRLKDSGRIDGKTYRDLYRKAKGNFFRNKRHMHLYMQQHHLLKDSSEAASGSKGSSSTNKESQESSSGNKKSAESQKGGGEK